MTRPFAAIAGCSALAAFALATSACETQKSVNPLSPNVAGPIPGVSISAPTPVSPGAGEWVVNTAPVKLVFSNSSSNGVRPFWYTVELASDSDFQQKLYARTKIPPAEGPQTSVVVEGTLAAERTYFWRVRADDGANASDYSSVVGFELIVPIVIETPVPLSPADGQTISSSAPTMTVTNAGVSGRAGSVEYMFEIAADQAFTQHLSLRGAPRSSGSTTSVQGPSLPAGSLFFWRAMGTNGTVNSPWSAPQAFRTPAAAPPPPPPPPPPSGGGGTGNVAGCINGVLADPRAYFFALIGRTEGSSAHDWVDVLTRSGIPAGLPPGHRAGSAFYGFTQQIGAAGVRGRLFLPTDIPDALGYYTHPVDLIDANGRWAWLDWLGGPPYAPRPCP